jgi:hypothetical protein
VDETCTELRYEYSPDGSLVIRDSTYMYVSICAKDRPAAALAVLGGITDELIDRIAAGIEKHEWLLTGGYWNDADMREDTSILALAALEAVFGVDE